MKTRRTILHYFNKIIVLVIHPNWGLYTWNFHWNENVIRHLTSQSLVWHSVRTVHPIWWFSTTLPIFRTEIIFQHYFLERERERESSCLSSLLKLHVLFFFQGIQKIYKLLTLHYKQTFELLPVHCFSPNNIQVHAFRTSEPCILQSSGRT